ncbi:MAG: DUF4290 domain-containing protein [Flavobacteriales bacterium]|nr:DUF4290 domain-containing protein [Flavobacteriales bacterium]
MEDTDALEYNTQRPTMHIPEYGRNVQKMVDHAVSLTDREERNKVAQAIIKVMGELNPHLRDVEEYKPKLWTHLFIMSEFQLDVDSPYPIPKKEQLAGKPDTVAYPQSPIKIGHYGKTVEKLIDQAKAMEDKDEREALVKTIASMMKRFHLTYNSNTIEDTVIQQHILKLSDGALELKDISFLPTTNEILKSNGGMNKQRNNNNKNRKNKNRNKNRKRH